MELGADGVDGATALELRHGASPVAINLADAIAAASTNAARVRCGYRFGKDIGLNRFAVA